MKVRKFISLGIMTLSLILTSCGSKTNSKDSSNSKEYPVVTKTIGASGGHVNDEESGLDLNIPAGALTENTKISAQYVEEPAKLSNVPILGFLCGAEFGPSGTTFEKPVEVSLKLYKTPLNNKLSVAYYDEENKLWEYAAEASIDDNVVKFEVTHFSKYQVLDLPISVFNQYVYIVREAMRLDKTDSWITETYLEYLLDDVHVMDYYGEYNGYIYRPIGFQINGQYAIDGKESDNNETVYRYGEINHAEFSSTTDYCLYGSMLSSYQEFKRQREHAAQENQEIIDILLVVYYKMCKPIIDLKAPDTELKKGESTTVTVRCHYQDPDNFFPELRDIDLPYYNLTISSGLTHLKVDKTELTTDENGKDTFKVTSKDGKGETVGVIFNVDGEYGEHAEGYITFFEEDEEITFAVTILMHEEDYIVVGDGDDYAKGYETINYTPGHVSITLDYSFTGTLTRTDYDSIDGRMTMSDVTVNIDSSPSTYERIYDYPLDADGHSFYERDSGETKYFQNPQINVNKTPANIKVFYSDYSDCYFYGYNPDFTTGDIFVEILAEEIYHRDYYSHTVFRQNNYDEETSYSDDDSSDCEWKRIHEVPCAGFDLREGTQERVIDDALPGLSNFSLGDERHVKTIQTVALTRIDD